MSYEIIHRITKPELFRELAYRPHRGQRKIHQSKKRFIIAICGRRWGKTLSAAREALHCALKPNAKVLVVAPYQRLTERIFFRIWYDLIRLRHLIPVESKSRSDYFIRFPWNAEIAARTAENPDNLVGEGYDLIVFDECAKARPDIWEHYLAPSLMDKCGRALFISTPEGFNWLYELYRQVKSSRRLRREWLAFTSPSSANPHIKRSELLLMGRLLSDFSYAQEICARFIRNINLVYPQFSIDRHVKPLSYDPSLPLYRALDFGYVNPFVCLTIQVAPNDEVRVLSEIYLRGHTMTELAQIMKNSLSAYFEKFREYWQNPYGRISRPFKAREFSPTPHLSPFSPQFPMDPFTGNIRFPQNLDEFNQNIIYFCDPAGAGERATLRELGFFTIARPAPISLGIELIRRALGFSQSGDTREFPAPPPSPRTLHPTPYTSPPTPHTSPITPSTPHLLIDPSCANLIREFTSYRYPDFESSLAWQSLSSPPNRSYESSSYEEQSQPSPSFFKDERSAIDDPFGSFLSTSAGASFSESPLKQSDHALDALRYFFVNMFA